MARRHRSACRRVAASLVALALFGLGIGFAAADSFLPAAGGWQTYVNDRYGFSVEYPPMFAADAAPENGDGLTFTSGAATLTVFAAQNLDDDTPDSLRRQRIGSDGYEHVTYSPSGHGWLVLSGFRADRIFYERDVFSGGVITSVEIEYPSAEKRRFDPIVTRIARSLKPGR